MHAPCATRPVRVLEGDALLVQESAYGTVGVVHAGLHLNVWWIRKEDDEIEPTWLVLDREDALYVVEGQLRLELRDEPERACVLSAGDCYVLPPDTPFRGYRYPRDGGPCLFLAVSAADVRERHVADRSRPERSVARAGAVRE